MFRFGLYKGSSLVLTSEMKRLFLFILFYKGLLEYSFWKVGTLDYQFFLFDFSFLKYLNGLLWCCVVFMAFDFRKKRASSFFLFLIYVLQIIPITVVYGMTVLTSPLYYNLLMFSFAICVVFVKHAKTYNLFKQYNNLSKMIILLFISISFFVIFFVFFQKGLPSLDLLNIYTVYEFRRNNPFDAGRFINYLFTMTAKVFLPVLMVWFAIKKKYIFSIFMALALLLLFLYSGHKMYLFSIFLCITGVFFSKKADCFMCFFKTLLLGLSSVCFLTSIWSAYEYFFIFIYSLFIKRVLFVPAMLKFYHYDYFSNHPLLGLYGAVPRSINPYIPDYYENSVPYPFEIGSIYFNAPLMSADTGFFAEAFARFGFLGFFIIVVLLAFIMIQIDTFQNRTSYRMAISIFLYPVYALSETQIIGSLFFGVWFFTLLIIFFGGGTANKRAL